MLVYSQAIVLVSFFSRHVRILTQHSTSVSLGLPINIEFGGWGSYWLLVQCEEYPEFLFVLFLEEMELDYTIFPKAWV